MGPVAIFAAAAAILVIGGAFAWRHPGWKGWEYVDLFYYLLGTAGIVLLFLAARSERELTLLYSREQPMQAAVQAIRSEEPNFAFNDDLIAKIDSGYRGLASDLFYASCVAPPVATGACSAQRDERKAFDAAFAGLGAPPSRRQPADRATYSAAFCKAVPKLLQALIGNETTSRPAYEAALSATREVEKNPGIALDPLALTQQRKRIMLAGAHAQDEYRAALDTPATREFVTDYVRQDTDYAMAVFYAGAACPGRLAEVQDDFALYNQWRARLAVAEQQLAAVRQRIAVLAEARHPDAADLSLRSFLAQPWPLVLLLAAGIKFARAIATLRDRKLLYVPAFLVRLAAAISDIRLWKPKPPIEEAHDPPAGAP